MKMYKDKVGVARDRTTFQLKNSNSFASKVGRSSNFQHQPDAIQLLQISANSSRRVTQLQLLQRAADASQQVAQRNELLEELEEPAQLKQNRTGLPDNLKTGMESMTGYALDHVKVHYNSSKPAALQAHAFAQGSDIHLGAGQQQHLPHELGHVVQQMEGRVQPSMSIDGIGINDDAGLEKEADILGARALNG